MGYPVQETPVVPERPHLKIATGGGMEDIEVDEGKKGQPSQPIPVSPEVPVSPEDSQRQKVRIKRLARLLSDQTGQGPFEEGDLVTVDKLGFGVVKWLGQLSGKSEKSASGKLIAGIEFVRKALCFYY